MAEQLPSGYEIQTDVTRARKLPLQRMIDCRCDGTQSRVQACLSANQGDVRSEPKTARSICAKAGVAANREMRGLLDPL